MLKWVAKVEICSKSEDFRNKLKILWCKMWLYSKLDRRFRFLGQFWYSKVVLPLGFSYRTLSLTYVRFSPKREIFLHFCPHFAISAKDMMLNDFKVTLNGSIIGPHISISKYISVEAVRYVRMSVRCYMSLCPREPFVQWDVHMSLCPQDCSYSGMSICPYVPESCSYSEMS